VAVSADTLKQKERNARLYVFAGKPALAGKRAVMLRVQELSAALGFNVYLTGGTVRDLVTGASLRDLDFTVEGKSLEDRSGT